MWGDRDGRLWEIMGDHTSSHLICLHPYLGCFKARGQARNTARTRGASCRGSSRPFCRQEGHQISKKANTNQRSHTGNSNMASSPTAQHNASTTTAHNASTAWLQNASTSSEAYQTAPNGTTWRPCPTETPSNHRETRLLLDTSGTKNL